ncbi:MAG: DNA ligase D [Betaproteobacteria bacterium]
MVDRLERYRQMRDFSRTPEPHGKKLIAKSKALRYYIQRHDATRLHYDLRLELEGVLKSWAVPKGPSLDPADKRLAVQTEDHPLEYGEFQGVIPEKQYGAGDVLLWDKGDWTPQDDDPVAALRKGRLHFRLDGEKLQGSWVLTRSRFNEDRPQWLLIKRNDEEARAGTRITDERPESVKRAPKRASRATRAGLPQFVSPQLATLVSDPPARGSWIYEVKHDGYRMLARLGRGDAKLFTRTGKDWSDRLPHLVAALKKLKLRDTWLDGEIVVLREDGRADFQALQNAFEAGSNPRGRDPGVVYYVFDAPFLRGQDLQRLPLKERKARLEAALRNAPAAVRYSDHLEGTAREILDRACEMQLEGLIGKDAESLYVAGRTKSWIKLKCRQRQDFVIVGYTAPGDSRTGFGALLVAVRDGERKLHFAGKVGTGFDERLLSSLTRKLSSITRPDPPVVDPPREKGVTWVEPKLVAEVSFAERTGEGILRQASFVGLREDISSRSVREERAQTLDLKITNPQRLVWPSLKISKLDLIRYYDALAEHMLPHVAGRPLTLVRCPDGAEAECFYQRHLGMGASPGEIKTFKRLRSSKGYYIYIDSHRGLLSSVQNGAVELHTWGATLPDAKHPDRITLDLDPDPDLPWPKLLDATRLTRTLVEGLGLKCFLKTTGGKGLHVVIPVRPALEWDEIKEFSMHMAEFLVRAQPGLFTSRIAKVERTGKVFVDYLRNSETASAVAAFSARARKNAGVSTPLAWDELGKADLRERFTVKTIPARLKRLKRDPWEGYAATQAITAEMRKALKK